MRCQFCGWDNPQGKDVCEKCNKPLVEFASRHIQEREMKESVNHDRPTERKSNSGFNPKATVRENFSRVDNGDGESEVCPECGYPLENGKCSITLSTMSKVFRALGISSAILDLGTAGKVVLW